MLMLTRRVGESIYMDINAGIRICVSEIRGKQVRLGVECSPDIRVLRQELHAKQNHMPLTQKKLTVITPSAVQITPRRRFSYAHGKITMYQAFIDGHDGQ